MRQTVMLGILVCSMTTAACSRSATPAAGKANPEFDRKWSALADEGAEALYIEDDRGQGLMGNVRRAGKLEQVAASTPPTADPSAALPERPSSEEIQRVIKQNLAAVKTCYLRMQRSGAQVSGKAIVSFQIGADGQPQAVSIDAPSFDGTALPACVTGQVSHWAFPRSLKGSMAQISYPFVFIGG